MKISKKSCWQLFITQAFFLIRRRVPAISSWFTLWASWARRVYIHASYGRMGTAVSSLLNIWNLPPLTKSPVSSSLNTASLLRVVSWKVMPSWVASKRSLNVSSHSPTVSTACLTPDLTSSVEGNSSNFGLPEVNFFFNTSNLPFHCSSPYPGNDSDQLRQATELCGINITAEQAGALRIPDSGYFLSGLFCSGQPPSFHSSPFNWRF